MGYFCIRFVEFMLNGRSSLDCTDLFSAKAYKRNDKIIIKFFSINSKMVKIRNTHFIICGKYEKYKNP